MDPSTSQKLFSTFDIPEDIVAIPFEGPSDGGLNFHWRHDISGYEEHVSTFSKQALSDLLDEELRQGAPYTNVRRILWDRDTLIDCAGEQAMDYSEYMDSVASLRTALRRLQEFGILFLKSVPSDPQSVQRLAERIGPLKNTFYGPTWDVRSVPSPKNVAYSSQNLGFHMDLLYMTDPPQIQFLHCMKGSAQGGESLFSDGFKAATKIRQLPDAVYMLKKYPVTFHYRNDGQWYQKTRSIFEFDNLRFDNSHFDVRRGDTSIFRPVGSRNSYGKTSISAINWSPPFQAPFRIKPRLGKSEETGEPLDFRKFMYACKMFKEALESKEAVFETKLDEGTCVIFDNRRILHARRAFSGDKGERWLRGAYVDKDVFRSRLEILDENSAPKRHVRTADPSDLEEAILGREMDLLSQSNAGSSLPRREAFSREETTLETRELAFEGKKIFSKAGKMASEARKMASKAWEKASEARRTASEAGEMSSEAGDIARDAAEMISEARGIFSKVMGMAPKPVHERLNPEIHSQLISAIPMRNEMASEPEERQPSSENDSQLTSPNPLRSEIASRPEEGRPSPEHDSRMTSPTPLRNEIASGLEEERPCSKNDSQLTSPIPTKRGLDWYLPTKQYGWRKQP